MVNGVKEKSLFKTNLTKDLRKPKLFSNVYEDGKKPRKQKNKKAIRKHYN